MGYGQLSGGVYRYEDMLSDRIDSYIPMNFDCIYDFANISTVGTDIVLDVTPVAAGVYKSFNLLFDSWKFDLF